MTSSSTNRRPLRWGLLGTGGIAHTVMPDLLLMGEEMTVHAVASRAPDKAESFASEFSIPHAYGSYADLVADPDIDVVYVTTPHSDHLASATLALEAGKHVLCEKPLAVSAAEVEQLTALARTQQVFLMEAMWMRTNPLVRRVAALVGSGELGEVRHVRAEFAFRFDGADDHRLLNPDLAGGAILDLGVYPMHAVNLYAGPPETLSATGTRRGTGVDGHTVALMSIPSRGGGEAVTATALASLDVTARTQCEILLTAGRVILDDFFHPESARVQRLVDGEFHTEQLSAAQFGQGYTFQAQEVCDCVRAGRLESQLVPWSSTLEVARALDRWRSELA